MGPEPIRVDKEWVNKFCDWWKNGKNSSDDKPFSQFYDKYVVWLLFHYLKEGGKDPKYSTGARITKSSLGDYRRFIEAYEKFKEDKGLADLNYKEIDIFMWTYGKLWSRVNNVNMDNDVKYRYEPVT